MMSVINIIAYNYILFKKNNYAVITRVFFFYYNTIYTYIVPNTNTSYVNQRHNVL